MSSNEGEKKKRAKRHQVEFSPDLHRQLSILAATNGLSVPELVHRLLEPLIAKMALRAMLSFAKNDIVKLSRISEADGLSLTTTLEAIEKRLATSETPPKILGESGFSIVEEAAADLTGDFLEEIEKAGPEHVMIDDGSGKLQTGGEYLDSLVMTPAPKAIDAWANGELGGDPSSQDEAEKAKDLLNDRREQAKEDRPATSRKPKRKPKK